MKNSKYLSRRIVTESLNEVGMGHLDENILAKIGSRAKEMFNKIRNMTNESAIAKYLKYRYSDAGREEAAFFDKTARLISKLNNN